MLLIMGPTASGKSALALSAAKTFDGVVINADSMQVYKELQVITARPDSIMTQAAPHRLYGFLSGDDVCSAARWADLAAAEVLAARDAGKLPIVVGGTGLYFRALTQGMSPIPDIPADVRQTARQEHAELGAEAYHARLAQADPEIAARLPIGDSQRIMRAWEVYLATGTPLSEWQKLPPTPPKLDLPSLTLALMPDRQVLYDRCDMRFDQMVDTGALDEVAELRTLNLDPSLPVMKALGVPELIDYLAGEKSRDAAVTDAKTGTRRYAKRQMTWLRNQIIADFTSDAKDLETMERKFFPEIRKFLLTLT